MNELELKSLLSKPFEEIKEEEYETLKKVIEESCEIVEPQEWLKYLYQVVDLIEKREDKEKSLEFVNVVYKEFSKRRSSSLDVRMAMKEHVCKGYLELGGYDNAHKAMNSYVFNAMAKINFAGCNHRISYYSFRPFSEYSLKDIKNETLSLAHPREFNDPLDTVLVYWLNKTIENQGADIEPVEFKFRLLLKKVTDNIKLRCLIGSEYKDNGVTKKRGVEDLSVLMWSHYAKSHTGFCVEYKFDRALFEVDNTEEKILMISNVEYPEKIDIEGRPSFEKALFQKSDFWEYEHEMRMAQFDCSIAKEGENREYPTIKCNGMIKAVYLGVNCSDKDRIDMVKAIGDKNIPLYQMQIDSDNLTRFKKIQIG